MTAKALIARDPKTYRRQGFELGPWDEDLDADLIADILAGVVVTIAYRWRERYSVRIPMHRIDWSIEEL